MNDQKLVEIVADGHHTIDEIASEAGLHKGHIYRVAKDAAERGVLAREKVGRAWHYHVPAGAADHEDAAGAPAHSEPATDGRMPVNRDYDWDEYVPDDAIEYISHNGELDEVRALVAGRDHQPVRGVIGGPTGCGKTTFAQSIAAENDFPMFTIQGKYTLREKDLLGSPTIVGGTTQWVDGVLTKALLASAAANRDDTDFDAVVLLVDEANRARAKAKSALFSALDHRATVTLDGGRGGEVIEGDANNLIVLATINEGAGYMVEAMDLAEKRRFGAKWNVDYLGLANFDREVELVATRTGVGYSVAMALVEAANDVRMSANDATSKVGTGVPTSAVLDWAAMAQSYDDAGIDNPVIRAADAQIVRAFYDGPEADTVAETLRGHLDGAPVDGDAFVRWADDEGVRCDDCGFEVTMADAKERGIDVVMNCPHCPGDLRVVTY